MKPFRFIALEKRLLFDASVAAVVADAVASASSTHTSDATEPAPATTAPPVDDHSPTAQEAGQHTTEQPVQLLVVSSSIQDANILAAAVNANTKVVVYDANNISLDSLIQQIKTTLNGLKADTIAFANEGTVNEFKLTENVTVSKETLSNDVSLRAFWHDVGSLVKDNGRVDFLACNFAFGNNTDALHELDLILDGIDHNVSIAASADRTSNIDGGDWTLEIGNVDAAAVYFCQDALSQWSGSMANFTSLSLGGATGFDINPTGSSNVSDATIVGTKLFFEATDGTSRQLYVSDGTVSGTKLVKVINNYGDANISNTISFGGKLFFAATNGYSGVELWRSDGTSSGTVMVSDIVSGSGSSNPHDFVIYNNLLWFIGGSSSNKLYSTNGFSVNSYTTGYTNMSDLTVSDTRLVMSGYKSSSGTEFIVFNPSTNYTSLIDIYSGSSSSSPTNITAVDGGYVMVSARGSSGGREPYWVQPSTGYFGKILDVGEGSNGSNPDNFILFNGMIYFTADNDTSSVPSVGVELFKSNATTDGTVLVNDIARNALSANPTGIVQVGDYLFFQANDNLNGAELWKTDGSWSGTQNVADLNTVAGAGSNPFGLFAIANRLIFTADSGTAAGNQVYISDGNSAGTTQLLSVSANSQAIMVDGNRVWILADNGSNGTELYFKTISSPDNNAPVSAAHTYTTYENLGFSINAASGLLAGATDVDGDTNLSFRIVSAPTHGTLTTNPDGSFGYYPDHNFTGTDTFTYQVSDGTRFGNIATVTLNVNTFTLPEAGTVIYSETFQSSSPDLSQWSTTPNPNMGSTEYNAGLTITTAPANGAKFLGTFGNQAVSLNLSGITVPHNAIQVSFDLYTLMSWDGSTMNAAGSSQFQGAPDFFDLLLDGVTLLHTTFSNNSSSTTGDMQSQAYPNNFDYGMNAPFTGSIAHNTLGYSSPTNSIGQSFQDATYHITFTVANSSDTFQALFQQFATNGALKNGGERFGIDNITVTALTYNDDLSTNVAYTTPAPANAGSTVDFTVNLANAGPGDSSGFSATINSDLTNITASGSLPPGLTFSNGVITVSSLARDSNLTLNFSGTVSPTHSTANITTSISITQANEADNDLANNNSSVSQAVNRAPIGQNDTYNGTEDITLNGSSVLANDTDADTSAGNLSASLVSGPSHGTLTLNANGTFSYIPTANYNGADSFSYRVYDGAVYSNNISTVTINLTSVNDAPIATADSYRINEDTTLNTTGTGVLANDSDIDSFNLTAVLVTNATHGTVTLNANGTFNYVPTLNYNGTDSFTYKVTDGSLESNTATVNITVAAVNDAPIAVNMNINIAEDNTYNGIITATDMDNSTLNAILVSGATHGIVTLNANGAFSYAPIANYNGTDSFTYKVNDGVQDSNTATVTITIGAVNDAPVAGNLVVNATEDSLFSGTISASDIDITRSIK